MKVNRLEIADVFGVSGPTIDAWVRDGMPVEFKGARGVPSVYDTAKCLKWKQDRLLADATGGTQQDADEIDRRTKRAGMLMRELDLAKARGEVAPVAEFERVQAARYALVRANCLNIPSRAVLQLLGETDEATFKRKLRAEIVLALDTAATAALELNDEDADDSA